MLLKRQFLLHPFTKRLINHRKVEVAKPRTNNYRDSLWDTINSSNIKSSADWKDVRHKVLSLHDSINKNNVDSLTVGVCTSQQQYQLAFSYLEFLKNENITLNLATLGKYLKLLHAQADGQPSADAEKEILEVYRSVRKSYPVLNATTLDCAIQALSITRSWQTCCELLKEIKLTSTPSSNAYSCIVAAAFLNNSDELGWEMFKEMLEKGRAAQTIALSSYFRKIKNLYKSADHASEAEKMFHFLQEHDLKMDAFTAEETVDCIKDLKATVKLTSVNQKGFCKSCTKKLDAFELTDLQFEDLKAKIVEKVIIGRDIFNKSSPQELAKFKNFVTNMVPHDVVIDGLNVAYSVGVKQHPSVTSGLLAAVVRHFADCGKKVLVLGRSHMNKWPRPNWSYICENATVFLTQDLSHDDPYFLYCALNSGKNTIIVTKDLMRGHKFLLHNMYLRILFDRWLSLRQYQLVHAGDTGPPIFKKPLPYTVVTQKNSDHWHLPYKSSDNSKYLWLCMKF